MRWKYETPWQRAERLQSWRPWFAWYPVYINGTAYWLEKVQKRYVMFAWEYYPEYKEL